MNLFEKEFQMIKEFTISYGSMVIKTFSISDNGIKQFNGFMYHIYNCLNGHKLYIKDNFEIPKTLELLGHQIVNENDIKGKNYYFKL